jgi:spermidine/putrescine transport system substrate-binding protein
VTRFDRRTFLGRAAVAGLAVPAVSALLAACSEGSGPGPPAASGALPVHPSDAVPSGQPVERGATLKIYEWKEYLSDHVLASFEEVYAAAGVRVQVESFFHVDEAVARLQQPDADFDVFFPTIDVLSSLVDARILRPLNHDYLPNLINLWPWFREGDGPFYDPGQRYTTPYTVYSSGIGWRRDLVRERDAPPHRDDPYGLLWDASYEGHLGMYDDYLEALSLALQRCGVHDVRDASDHDLSMAADMLSEGVRGAGVHFTLDGAQEGLPTGVFVAHQAWSGDVLSAPRYAADHGMDRDAVGRTLGYWSPDGATKVVGCDLTAVCAAGRNPVLAHAFLDHLLAFDVALDNFTWNGYQVPMEGASRDEFRDPGFPWHDAVPETLLSTLLTPQEIATGQWLVGFGPSERARWLDQWKRVAPAEGASLPAAW